MFRRRRLGLFLGFIPEQLFLVDLLFPDPPFVLPHFLRFFVLEGALRTMSLSLLGLALLALLGLALLGLALLALALLALALLALALLGLAPGDLLGLARGDFRLTAIFPFPLA